MTALWSVRIPRICWGKNARVFPKESTWAQGSNSVEAPRLCPAGHQQDQADLSRGAAGGGSSDSQELRKEELLAGIKCRGSKLQGGQLAWGSLENSKQVPTRDRVNFKHCRECEASSQ